MPTKHIFAGETRIVSKTDAIWMQTPMISNYHPDHLGSTSYTSASEQTLLQHERSFPFGERDIGDQEECDLGRADNMRRDWLFTSKEWDWDTGLLYFGARYFDPRMAMWQSPDPILYSYMKGKGNAGGFEPGLLGLYSYSWNNPVVMKDPDGRDGIVVKSPHYNARDSAAIAASADSLVVAANQSGVRTGPAIPLADVPERADKIISAGGSVAVATLVGHGGRGTYATDRNSNGEPVGSATAVTLADNARVDSLGTVQIIACDGAPASDGANSPGAELKERKIGITAFFQPLEYLRDSTTIYLDAWGDLPADTTVDTGYTGKVKVDGVIHEARSIKPSYFRAPATGKSVVQNMVDAERAVAEANSKKGPHR